MNQAIRLDNWSTTVDPNPYLAPELQELCLQGTARNHPRFGEARVRTSPIVRASTGITGNRFVWTRSGSCYYLGKIDKGFREWLRKNRPNWDWRKPITIQES